LAPLVMDGGIVEIEPHQKEHTGQMAAHSIGAYLGFRFWLHLRKAEHLQVVVGSYKSMDQAGGRKGHCQDHSSYYLPASLSLRT
jgi:hypothetical protein